MNYNNISVYNFICIYCKNKCKDNHSLLAYDTKYCNDCNVNYRFSSHDGFLYHIQIIIKNVFCNIYHKDDEIIFIANNKRFDTYKMRLSAAPDINIYNAQNYFEQVLKLEILK